ncbi:MAG: NADH-quinone oxidoreductase subunit L, partial [Acidimicrobiales bacterium]
PEPVGAGAAASPAAHGGHGGHGAGQPHESPWPMALPLVVLAGLAVVGGVINIPFLDLKLEHWLEPVFGEALHHSDASTAMKVQLAGVAVLAAAAGIAFAYTVFMRARRIDALQPGVLKRAWGVDSLYSAVVEAPGRALSAFAAYVVDARIIDGAVNGLGALVRGGGGVLRKVQTGYVRNYALGVAFGATLLLGWVMVRTGG